MKIRKAFNNYFRLGCMELIPRVYFGYPTSSAPRCWELVIGWLWFEVLVTIWVDE